jgi:hypothetical protein
MMELLHKKITDRILAAFFHVHAEVGPGYLESVYIKAIATEAVQRLARP